MCVSADVSDSMSLESLIERGMPEKIAKSVMYSMKRRIEHKNSKETKNNEVIVGKSCSCTLNSALASKPSTTNWIGKILYDKKENEAGLNQSICYCLCQKSQANDYKQTLEYTNKALNIDLITRGMQFARQFVVHVHIGIKQFQQTVFYRLLTQTTQPAHIILLAIFTLLFMTLWPEVSSVIYAVETKPKDKHISRALINVVYLAAFSIHFGSQIWMTFVSGLSLYFSLPRHIFGQCQQILFPRYFAINSVLSIGMLTIFVKHFLHTINYLACVQLSALILTAVIEVTIRLYLAPPMLRLMEQKYKIEAAIGSGREVGSLKQANLSQCPHYQRIHMAFRRIHTIIAAGNILVLLATCLHLHFLAIRIQISID